MWSEKNICFVMVNTTVVSVEWKKRTEVGTEMILRLSITCNQGFSTMAKIIITIILFSIEITINIDFKKIYIFFYSGLS